MRVGRNPANRCERTGTERGRCHNLRRSGDIYCLIHSKKASVMDVWKVAIRIAEELISIDEKMDTGAAMIKATQLAVRRYEGGKCKLCGQDSGPCAIRHSIGRSCA